MDISNLSIKTHYSLFKASYKPKQGDSFIRGPIPLDWVAKLNQETPVCFKMGIYLWFIAGLAKSSRFKVNLSDKRLSLFGLSRTTASKSLKRIQKIGLVSVVRRAGQTSEVTLHF